MIKKYILKPNNPSPMSELTNYLKERINYYEELKKTSVLWSVTHTSYIYILFELQSVLSKIEELQELNK